MEISQEALDSKLAESKAAGKAEGVSEKESEMQSQIAEVEKKAKETVDNAEKGARQKISEQGDEVGNLRGEVKTLTQFKTDNEGKLSKFGEMESALKSFEDAKTEAEKAATKKKEEDAKTPEEKLTALNVTDEEVKQADEFMKTLPAETAKTLTDETARLQAYHDVVVGLREASPESGDNSLAAFLAKKKAASVNDPKSVGEVLKQSLLDKDKKRNPISSRGRAAGFNRVRGAEDEYPADKRPELGSLLDKKGD